MVVANLIHRTYSSLNTDSVDTFFLSTLTRNSITPFFRNYMHASTAVVDICSRRSRVDLQFPLPVFIWFPGKLCMNTTLKFE